jgi:hypothetical protein
MDVHKSLSMKHFHGVSAGNVHECSLKSRIGKARSKSPAELEQTHQAFIQPYNTTAHQGLLKDGFDPPIPIEVLAEAKARIYSQDGLAQKFSRALFPRTTNCYGCVTLQSCVFHAKAATASTAILPPIPHESCH